MYFSMVVCVSLSISVCMFTVSNALLMSNATAMVRVGGMGWLKPVATVLLMLCKESYSVNYFLVIQVENMLSITFIVANSVEC